MHDNGTSQLDNCYVHKCRPTAQSSHNQYMQVITKRENYVIYSLGLVKRSKHLEARVSKLGLFTTIFILANQYFLISTDEGKARNYV